VAQPDRGVEHVLAPTGAALLAGLVGVMHDQGRDAATAQPKQPLLDPRPGVDVVIAQHIAQARQIVEDDQLDVLEVGLDLGLHLRRADVADAVDQVAGQDLERLRRWRLAAVDAPQPSAQFVAFDLAVEHHHTSCLRRPPFQEGRAGRDRIGDAKRDVGLAERRGRNKASPALSPG
jgi:hypothetical protein